MFQFGVRKIRQNRNRNKYFYRTLGKLNRGYFKRHYSHLVTVDINPCFSYMNIPELDEQEASDSGIIYISLCNKFG